MLFLVAVLQTAAGQIVDVDLEAHGFAEDLAAAGNSECLPVVSAAATAASSGASAATLDREQRAAAGCIGFSVCAVGESLPAQSGQD